MDMLALLAAVRQSNSFSFPCMFRRDTFGKQHSLKSEQQQYDKCKAIARAVKRISVVSVRETVVRGPSFAERSEPEITFCTSS